MEFKDCLDVDNFKVDKDDLVNIAVSKYEGNLLSELDVLESELRTLNLEKSDLQEKKIRMIKECLDNKFGDKSKKACAALKGCGIECRTNIAFKGLDENGDIQYVIKFDLKNAVNDEKGFTAGAEIGTFYREDTTQTPKKVTEISLEISELGKVVSSKELSIGELNGKLKNMNSTIRKARANLTSNMMEKFSDGKDIVNALIESVSTQKRLK